MASVSTSASTGGSTLDSNPPQAARQLGKDEELESRENPTGLSKILSRTRRASNSRSPSRNNLAYNGDNQSTNSTGTSFFSRMTGATSNTPHEHSHNPLSALKGVFSNRPSSRDRNGTQAEDGLDRSTTGTTVGERGREKVVSTGRGGAGNIRASSESRAPNDPDSGDEARERSRERSRERGHGSGRGGAGNFRSASKNPEARIKEQQAEEENAETERLAQEKRLAEESKHAHSYGRGGAGNIK